MDIKPLEGLGDLKFGFTRNQVKEILGEASEIDTFKYEEDEDEELTESWHYDDKEISLSFDEIEDWKLVNFAISAEDYKLNGKAVIGLKKEELLKTIEAFDMGEIMDDEENNVISVVDTQVNFWFDEGEVAEVQWNVDWNEEGEAVFPN